MKPGQRQRKYATLLSKIFRVNGLWAICKIIGRSDVSNLCNGFPRPWTIKPESSGIKLLPPSYIFNSEKFGTFCKSCVDTSALEPLVALIQWRNIDDVRLIFIHFSHDFCQKREHCDEDIKELDESTVVTLWYKLHPIYTCIATLHTCTKMERQVWVCSTAFISLTKPINSCSCPW